MNRETDGRSGRIREHLRTNVVGYIAIFLFATGGSAIALQSRNTVDSGDIKNGQVTRNDIAPNAVNGSRVARNSLAGGDINEKRLGPVPSSANSAALGGTPAAAVVHTNPALAAGTAPFMNKGSFAISSTDSGLDLGIVTLRGTGPGIRVCNDVQVALAYQIAADYEDQTAAGSQTMEPSGCRGMLTRGIETIQLAVESGGAGVIAFLLDTNRDGIFRVWWLG